METQVQAVGVWRENLFKSYYVVWKRRYSSFSFRSLPEFKSYYVVWKLLREKGRCIKKNSLNRTM